MCVFHILGKLVFLLEKKRIVVDANGEKVVVVVGGVGVLDLRTESDPLAIFSHLALCPEILTLSTALSRCQLGLASGKHWQETGKWRTEKS